MTTQTTALTPERKIMRPLRLGGADPTHTRPRIFGATKEKQMKMMYQIWNNSSLSLIEADSLDAACRRARANAAAEAEEGHILRVEFARAPDKSYRRYVRSGGRWVQVGHGEVAW